MADLATRARQLRTRAEAIWRRLSLEVVIDDVSELVPDPDDADIVSGRRQWIVSYVPPGDILWESP